MRGNLASSFIILLQITGCCLFLSSPASSGTDTIIIEDFQKYGNNPFPDWSFENDYDKAASIYTITSENGKKFLRASTLKVNKMIQLGKQLNDNNIKGASRVNWNIYSHPFLSWGWRVKTIPAGANENNDKLNDSAASIYVVFQKTRLPFTDWRHQPANWIKYVWSSTLPVGTVVTKKLTKFGVSLYEGKYIVVASGNKNLGKWITFKRNVLADYRAHFGRDPEYQPAVIGIVTDSNSTKSLAEADYDDIIASRN